MLRRVRYADETKSDPGEHDWASLRAALRISRPPPTSQISINPASADLTRTRACEPLDTRSTDKCATSLQCHLIEIKIGTAGANTEKATNAKEQKKMGRLPYEKQYELAYQIYEALCAQHPDRLVALSDTRALLAARAAAALTARPTSGDSEPSSTGSV